MFKAPQNVKGKMISKSRLSFRCQTASQDVSLEAGLQQLDDALVSLYKSLIDEDPFINAKNFEMHPAKAPAGHKCPQYQIVA